MPLHKLFHPRLQKNVKFGRKLPRPRGPTLRLAKYLRKSLPSPPASFDYAAPSIAALRDILGNGDYGDCVEAALMHMLAMVTANAGSPVVPTTAETLALYSALTGFKASDPSTDDGTNIVDALNYVVSKGFMNGTRALGYVMLDPTDELELASAMWLFENIVFGAGLPDSYVNIQGDGFVWGPGTVNPINGHCFLGVGGSPAGIEIDTWGDIGTFTFAGIAEVCSEHSGGEVYAVLTPDILNRTTQKAPSGFDLGQLISDLDSLGANVPMPAPTPVPSPNLPPDLSAVQSALDAAFASYRTGLMTRTQAKALVDQTIAKLAAGRP